MFILIFQPNINKHNKKGDSDQDKDCISYTISAPSGRGTAMFSVDGQLFLFF